MSSQVYGHVVPDSDLAGQVVSLPDRDYFLRDGAGWFGYNGVTIRIRHNEPADCLEVAAYRTDHEDEEFPLCEYCVPYSWAEGEALSDVLARVYERNQENLR